MKTLIKLYIVILYGFLTACGSNQNSILVETIAPYNTDQLSEKYNPNEQTNEQLDFYNFMCGINSVVVLTESKLENSLNIDDEFFRKYYKLLKQYLLGIGIENIAITQEEQLWIENNIPLEQTASLIISIDENKNYISRLSMLFKSCNGDEFKFVADSDYYIDVNWDDYLLKKMRKMFWKRVVYCPENTIPLKKEMTVWNKNSLRKHFDSSGVDALEGIYEKYGVGNSSIELKYCIAVLKEHENYNIIYLSGANNSKNWTEGELKGTITKTSIKDFYKVKWIMSNKSVNENVYLGTSKYNFLEFDFLNSEADYKTRYLKMYPIVSNKIVSSNNYLSSGSGFIVSNNGLLVTNHHIVQNAKNISIQVKVEDKLEEYKADVVMIDKENDLAILKVSDSSYSSNSTIPFKIYKEESPIGSSVFTLGYPMIETMGETLKLSDGIISAQSGYMANNSAYQVTVPINPGNSGGPLFDKKGNLVGIINAKYTGAENVAYAIKSKILLSMLEELKLKNHAAKSFNKNDVDLVENVQNLNSLVCLIKVYN